jgi:hypothetical protein
LAARSLPSETFRYERWCWIASFVGIALVGIVLAFVQQVVLTTEQAEAEKAATTAQARLEADNRFTQGQLDSINKVLAIVVTSKGGDSELVSCPGNT